MSFHEVQFPVDVSYGSSGGPGYSTNIIEVDSGAEQRIARWSSPKYSWDAAYGIKTHTQLAAVRNFYIARLGCAFGFRYKDWHDYASTADGQIQPAGAANTTHTDQTIGTGEGGTTTFQLIKNYISGATLRTRVITKPVSGTVKVGLDGVLQSSGYTVDYTTGIITFTVGPADGVVVTAGYEFDVPARFGKEIDNVLSLSYDEFSTGSASSIPIIEITSGVSIPGEFPFGGYYERTITANYTVGLGNGRFQAISAGAGSLTVSLPSPVGLPPGGPYLYLLNGGSNTFTVKDHLGVTLSTLTAGSMFQLIIAVDGSGNNVWYAF